MIRSNTWIKTSQGYIHTENPYLHDRKIAEDLCCLIKDLNTLQLTKDELKIAVECSKRIKQNTPMVEVIETYGTILNERIQDDM